MGKLLEDFVDSADQLRPEAFESEEDFAIACWRRVKELLAEMD